MSNRTTTIATHTCVYFDDVTDGTDDLLCACGQRATYVVENGEELLVVLLDDDESVLSAMGRTPAATAERELAFSA
jgi:hypothetical protein